MKMVKKYNELSSEGVLEVDFHNEALLLKIEEKRKYMINLAHQFGFTNTAVVQCSQELDELLNKYKEILIS